MQKTNIVITVPEGLCQYLKTEVEALGLPVTSVTPTSLSTAGTPADAMMLNLHIRTGHHVLYQIAAFKSRNADELYKEMSKIPWETIIPSSEYLSVVSNVRNATIKDTRFPNLRCKDAIVDRIQARKGRRPDSGPDETGAVISLYWRDDRCIVYIDTSGEPLSRRGYRRIPLGAPMQETLAAGVVAAMDLKSGEHFVNPMCGSGTMAIEAALSASGRVPGLTRQNFGFMHVMGFDLRAWDEMKKAAKTKVLKTLPSQIIATDTSEKAIDAARKNAMTAGVEQLIQFEVCDYAATPVPPAPGAVVLNPGYGMRMGEEPELVETYRGIGSFFKQKCKGYRGAVFTANTALAGQVGLKAKRKIPFVNGKIECRLYVYDLY
ncbi:MAG: class I SAM-dependent RNA methyltransferase [Chitinispirillia bacterium]|nr:class I SAM-dependent RNA methyltransferase [Chitinispirillia bacterium]